MVSVTLRMAEESERMFSESLLRINDLSSFQEHLNMTCDPSVVEGKWYRMRFDWSRVFS